MLPPKNRLTKKNDFDLVFKKGKSRKGDFLLVKVLKTNLPQSRFGFVVSKKISNKATVRNKVKRRLRDAAKEVIGAIHQSLNVVIVALPGIEKKEYFEIQEVVGNIFKEVSGLNLPIASKSTNTTLGP